MDKRWKEKWVEALRSGKYEQGHFAMCERNKFCCLGVICEIHPDVTRQSRKHSEAEQFTFKDSSSAVELPFEFADKIGVDHGSVNVLIALNDDQNKTFPEIADYIEENL